MLKNYFITAIRTFKQQLGFSILNLAGLSLGTACFVLIALLVKDELTFDRHYSQSDKIYEGSTFYDGGFGSGMNSYFTSVAKERIPEIEDYAHIGYSSTVVMEDNGSLVFEQNHYSATPEILGILDLDLLYGDQSSALQQKGTVVISKEIMDKYFNGENPIGQYVEFKRRGVQRIITGVLNEQPRNSSYQFNFIEPANMSRFLNEETRWNPEGGGKFLLINPEADIEDVKTKLSDLAVELGYPGNSQFKFVLDKLADKHLYGSTLWDTGMTETLSNVYVFSIIGVMLLVIAVINYVNATTARMLTRNKEIGVRKTLGAGKNIVRLQYFTESFVLSVLAVLLAAGLVELLLPKLNELADKNLQIHYFDQESVILFYVLMIPILSILSGFYPAIFSSRFRALDVLRNSTKGGKGYVRNGLVGFQFAITLALLFSSNVISKQINKMKDVEMNANVEDIISPRLPTGKTYQTMASELATVPGVEAVFSSPFPSTSGSLMPVVFNNDLEPDTLRVNPSTVSADVPEQFELTFLQGATFSKEADKHRREVILNKKLASLLPWENPIGETIRLLNDDYRTMDNYTIVGVVADMNFIAKYKPRPTYLRVSEQLWQMNIKLEGSNNQETIKALNAKWDEIAPNNPMRYNFMADSLDKAYDQERKFGQTFGYFSWIAIGLACIGILGLSIYTVTKMYKEIGIRKVLGASSIRISQIIISKYLKIGLVATLVAVPAAWLYMNNWLENYAIQATIGVDIFLLGILTMSAFIILTIGFQTVKAANTNPVNILKDE